MKIFKKWMMLLKKKGIMRDRISSAARRDKIRDSLAAEQMRMNDKINGR